MAKKRRSAEQVADSISKAKVEVASGEPVGLTMKKYGITSNQYYSSKPTKAKRKYTKGAKKIVINPSSEVSFKELDTTPGRTMIIVTNDAETVSNILIAAFGRGA